MIAALICAILCVPVPGTDLAPAAGGAAACVRAERIERTAWVMGTLLRIEVQGAERACALGAAEAALREVERLDAVLSSWRADSELAALNGAAPGAAQPLSAELLALLVEADEWRAATGGAFEPAVGALVDAWDLRGAGRVPSPQALGVALAASRLTPCFDLTARARLQEACWLDSGGFGKGAALRAAARVLAEHGVAEAVLDFGGQLLVLGGPVRVAAAHPQVRDRAVLELRVAGASVATSSQSERFIEADGVRYGHLLDPRTGRPVPAWGSVTVVAGDPLVADILSTALFVLGPDGAMEWAAARPDVGVLVLRSEAGDVAASWNPALERFLEQHTPNGTSKETPGS